MAVGQIFKDIMRGGSHFLLLCVFLFPKGSSGNGYATTFPGPKQVPLILVTDLAVFVVRVSMLP